MLDLAARVLAAATPTGSPTPVDNDVDTESAKSGPIGLVVIILLCVACYFLFKSLSKHLRKVREGEVPVSASPVLPAGDGPAAASVPPVVDDESAADAADSAEREPAPPT